MISTSAKLEDDVVVRLANRIGALGLSRGGAIALATLFALVAAYGDAVTDEPTTFTLLYVMALAFGTWFAGPRFGYVLTAVAVAGGVVASVLTPSLVPLPGRWFILWNAAADVVLYVASVRLIWALRLRLNTEISARHAAVGQLRHAERLTTIGKLASGIAHEIGTPLNVISGRTELILSGALSPEAVKASANIVLEQTERVAVIIRQLLRFARSSGTEAETADLTDLAEVTALMLAPIAAKRGVEITCQGTHPEANVNRSEMQQVVTNLVTNAIHAMPEGGRIEIDSRTDRVQPPGKRDAGVRPYAVVRVRDHGTGIAPDVLPRIFDPFFTTKDVGSGTGLGLSVAYGIVQDHQGWITIDTRLGEGTTMSVYIPSRDRAER